MPIPPDLRAEVMTALSTAGAYCGGCDFEPGESGCPDCMVVRGLYTDAVMTIIERLCAEPIIARWSKGVTHHDAGTTVECVDADDPLRGIALELDLEDREALGLMLVDPDDEMDQADDGIPLLLAPADLTELALILTAERYRLDKGDRPVPQPRWGANVRISQAVQAALDIDRQKES